MLSTWIETAPGRAPTAVEVADPLENGVLVGTSSLCSIVTGSDALLPSSFLLLVCQELLVARSYQ